MTDLLLVHAFPLNSEMWSPLREELGDEVRLVTPDVAGFGSASLPDAEPSLDVCADELARVLDDLGLETAVIGGLSMGGYVALAFARRHPHRVQALVLADTKASADVAAAAENRLRIAGVAEAEQSPRVVVEELVPKLTGATTKGERPQVIEHVDALAASAPPAAIAWAQRAMAARLDTFDVLKSLDVPVLVIVGEDDGVTPVADSEALLAASARGTLSVLAGAGHLSAVEDAQAFAAALRTWLAAL